MTGRPSVGLLGAGLLGAGLLAYPLVVAPGEDGVLALSLAGLPLLAGALAFPRWVLGTLVVAEAAAAYAVALALTDVGGTAGGVDLGATLAAMAAFLFLELLDLQVRPPSRTIPEVRLRRLVFAATCAVAGGVTALAALGAGTTVHTSGPLALFAAMALALVALAVPLRGVARRRR